MLPYLAGICCFNKKKNLYVYGVCADVCPCMCRLSEVDTSVLLTLCCDLNKMASTSTGLYIRMLCHQGVELFNIKRISKHGLVGGSVGRVTGPISLCL